MRSHLSMLSLSCKAIDFYKLILYPATFLKLFMVSRSFSVEFFGSFRYKIMSSANKDSLTSSLPICIPFIYFFCFIALARNFQTMLNRSRESEHPCLNPDFRGNGFSFVPLSMMLAIGLSYIAFNMLRYIPLFLVSLEFLSWNGVEFYQRFFLHLLRWSSSLCLCFC
jgi:hypothetical protein